MSVINFPDALAHAYVAANPEAASEVVIQEVLSALHKGLVVHEKVGMFLAGGTSYQEVEAHLAATNFPWSRVTIFHTDVHFVPDTDPASSNAPIEQWLKQFPKEKPEFVRCVDTGTVEEAAADYQEKLKKWLLDYPVVISLVGMGKDGHIASLFPKGSQGLATDALIVVTEPEYPPLVPRFSLSPAGLAKAEQTICLVMGAEKGRVLAEVEERQLPATLLPANTLFVLDQAASPQ